MQSTMQICNIIVVQSKFHSFGHPFVVCCKMLEGAIGHPVVCKMLHATMLQNVALKLF